MARIYVSSTKTDLNRHRLAVSTILRQLGHEDVAMEYYTAEAMPPLEKCLADVSRCDVYLGIFAWRYGYVPPAGNPDGRSITELEYLAARKGGRDCLIFLQEPRERWPAPHIEHNQLEQMTRLRLQLQENNLCAAFHSVDSLRAAVATALSNWAPRKQQRPDEEDGPDLQDKILELNVYIARARRLVRLYSVLTGLLWAAGTVAAAVVYLIAVRYESDVWLPALFAVFTLILFVCGSLVPVWSRMNALGTIELLQQQRIRYERYQTGDARVTAAGIGQSDRQFMERVAVR